MEISELVWKLFILLLPGIITTLFIRYITTNKYYPPFYFVIYSAILGLGLFIFLEIIISFFNISISLINSTKLKWGVNLSVWDIIINSTDGKTIKILELLIAYISAIPFGLLIGYIIQHKIFHRFLQKIKLTSRFADGDVWTYYLRMKEVEWIVIRNSANNLAYYGNVISYSESKDKREILLQNVDVFTNDTWKKLYSANTVFLELDDNAFSIEVLETEEQTEYTI